MTRAMILLALMLTLGACEETNPIFDPGDPIDDPDDPDDGIDCVDGGRCLPPGTDSPTPNRRIVRREATADGSGNGYARDISYDAATDTFSVENLGFDGDNAYSRGAAVGSLGPFAVYESDAVFADDVTGVPIGQFTHRAIYAVSTSGETQLAIVRTGSYIPYGFGGYVYQRNGRVTLPTSGQASYAGNYAALRDFNGRGGLEYATGDMEMAIDFNDFDDGNAVNGAVFNRRIFDLSGNDITADVLADFNEENEASLTTIPTLLFAVGPGVMDENGEITGAINSFYANDAGTVQAFEAGNYYAVVADGDGGNASEVVGVIVVEGSLGDGVTARETGGFLLYRP